MEENQIKSILFDSFEEDCYKLADHTKELMLKQSVKSVILKLNELRQFYNSPAIVIGGDDCGTC